MLYQRKIFCYARNLSTSNTQPFLTRNTSTRKHSFYTRNCLPDTHYIPALVIIPAENNLALLGTGYRTAHFNLSYNTTSRNPFCHVRNYLVDRWSDYEGAQTQTLSMLRIILPLMYFWVVLLILSIPINKNIIYQINNIITYVAMHWQQQRSR